MGKRFLLILSIISFGYSCTRENSKDIFLTISPEKINCPASGHETFAVIRTNSSWKIDSVLPEWVSIDITDSGSEYVLNINVSENTQQSNRSSIIVFSFGNERKDFIISQESRKELEFGCDRHICIDGEEQSISIPVRHNIPYSISLSEDWLNFDKADYGISRFDDSIDINISANNYTLERTGKVIVLNEKYNLRDTLEICQGVLKHEEEQGIDGACHILQSASKGTVNLVIMGDGFTTEAFGENNYYNNSISDAMKYFFSIEPYCSLIEYFNVYQVDVISQEDGVGSLKKMVNNRLGTIYGEGTSISCNASICKEYADRVGLPDDSPLTIIVILNDDKYAGTTYMYSDGSSIALCPMCNEASPNDFEGLIHHEAGGHGFGLLCDEYVYYEQPYPQDEIEEMTEWQKDGFYLNLDLHSKPHLWKDLIDSGYYPEVGMYEGGDQYRYGIFRCEENSCMNDNIPYFNAQSRRLITNRVMDLSGIDYTFEDFVANDTRTDTRNKPSNLVNSKSRNVNVPLGSPVKNNYSFHQINSD